MFGVIDRITNGLDRGRCLRERIHTQEEVANVAHILEEYLEITTSLSVDQARDTLHTSATRETTNGWLGGTYSVCKTMGVADKAEATLHHVL